MRNGGASQQKKVALKAYDDNKYICITQNFDQNKLCVHSEHRAKADAAVVLTWVPENDAALRDAWMRPEASWRSLKWRFTVARKSCSGRHQQWRLITHVKTMWGCCWMLTNYDMTTQSEWWDIWAGWSHQENCNNEKCNNISELRTLWQIYTLDVWIFKEKIWCVKFSWLFQRVQYFKMYDWSATNPKKFCGLQEKIGFQFVKRVDVRAQLEVGNDWRESSACDPIRVTPHQPAGKLTTLTYQSGDTTTILSLKIG